MLDHPSRHDASATVAERRAQLAASASALKERLSANRLIADGAAGLQRAAGTALNGVTGVIERNPAAAALTIAGLAWLILGTRGKQVSAHPHFEAVSRWEDEGGNPHPEYQSTVEEVGQLGPVKDTGGDSSILGQIRRAVQDYPFPLGMVAVALGGVLAARLPATEIEQAVVSDARDHLREQARRLLDEGRERVETAATDLKDSLREDLHSAKAHVAEAIDTVTHPNG